MIRDRLVVGLRDARLSETLQLDSKLTRQDSVTRAKNSEFVRAQQSSLRAPHSSPTSTILAAIQPLKPAQDFSLQRQRVSPPHMQQHPSSVKGTCDFCGYSNHSRSKCLARSAECRYCHSTGYFSRVCRKKARSSQRSDCSDNAARQTSVSAVSTDSTPGASDNVAFLGSVEDCKHPWLVAVVIRDVLLHMKVDTAACVSAVSHGWLRAALPDARLAASDQVLRGPDSSILRTIGQFSAELLPLLFQCSKNCPAHLCRRRSDHSSSSSPSHTSPGLAPFSK